MPGAGLVSPATAALARYLAGMPSRRLPGEVTDRAKMHILDTLASVVSGSRRPAGRSAAAWLDQTGSRPETGPCTVLGQGRYAAPTVAALCNGLSAHAEETDDSHAPSLSHPGCATVPAALALAERTGASGEQFIRAVVAGYDLGGRVGRSLKAPERDRAGGRWSSHAVVGTFCAVGAAAVLLRFDEARNRYLFSYASQLASGTTTWLRDPHHVEKAFVFAGMPAHHGVLAATLVEAGLSGVEDVFAGSPNWLEIVEPNPAPEWLAWQLGTEFEIMHASIKKYPVGSPAQAAVDAAVQMLADGDIRPGDIDQIEVRLPAERARVVDARVMANINVQYLVAATLLDGRFTASIARDWARLHDPGVVTLTDRTTLIPDRALSGTGAAIVTVRLAGDQVRTCTVTAVRGTPSDPMTWDEVRAKAEDLLAEVLGRTKARDICEAAAHLQDMPDVRSLARLCEGPAPAS
jgi:2-methylcitrate dehydratase PrpD